MTTASDRFITERLAYPAGAPLKLLYKSPILLYRLGLGPLIGRLFMIMTTTGRKSGLPRRTAIEFHQHAGRKYVLVGWTQSDWYQNLMANPLMTIQTAAGVERVRARRLDSPQERAEAWEVAENSPGLRMAMKLSGVTLTREEFVAQSDRFVIVTFDPTDDPTPPPLEADLRWALLAFMNVLWGVVIPFIVRRRLRAQRARRLQRP